MPSIRQYCPNGRNAGARNSLNRLHSSLRGVQRRSNPVWGHTGLLRFARNDELTELPLNILGEAFVDHLVEGDLALQHVLPLEPLELARHIGEIEPRV